MDYMPTGLQTLFLWRLLAAGGGEFLSDIKPALEAKDRRPLERAGFLDTEKRLRQRTGKRPVKASYVSLTEQGWEWAGDHLDADLSARSTAAAPILRAMLTRLKAHLQYQRCSLAEFISHSVARASSAQNDGQESAELVRAAYGKLSGHQSNRRVRLADLRAVLGHVPRARLDNVLLQMEREDRAVLYPLDNPQEIGPEDEQAALANSVGEARHVIYMED